MPVQRSKRGTAEVRSAVLASFVPLHAQPLPARYTWPAVTKCEEIHRKPKQPNAQAYAKTPHFIPTIRNPQKAATPSRPRTHRPDRWGWSNSRGVACAQDLCRVAGVGMSWRNGIESPPPSFLPFERLFLHRHPRESQDTGDRPRRMSSRVAVRPG